MKEFIQSNNKDEARDKEINALIKFAALLSKKVGLWKSIVEESSLSPNVKSSFISKLNYFLDSSPSTEQRARRDSYHTTAKENLEWLNKGIDVIMRNEIMEKEDPAEAEAVSKNIKEDINSFIAELYS